MRVELADPIATLSDRLRKGEVFWLIETDVPRLFWTGDSMQESALKAARFCTKDAAYVAAKRVFGQKLLDKHLLITEHLWSDTEAASALDAKDKEIARLKAEIKSLHRELRDAQNDAAAEARWQERQGGDYGSY